MNQFNLELYLYARSEFSLAESTQKYSENQLSDNYWLLKAIQDELDFTGDLWTRIFCPNDKCFNFLGNE